MFLLGLLLSSSRHVNGQSTGAAAQPALTPEVALQRNMDVMRNSVVFIYWRDPTTQQLHEDGTAFVLGIPTLTGGRLYIVLVTARHMVDPAFLGCPSVDPNDLVVRMNLAKFDPDKDDKGSVDASLRGLKWYFPGDSLDLAFAFLNGSEFEKLGVANKPVHISQLPTAVEAAAITTGDRVVSAGLLQGATGRKRNYPVFKFGNISSIMEEKIEVASGCGKPSKFLTEWLVAASLVQGNSGSPILLQPEAFGVKRPVLLGVQSVSFEKSAVAGMAPIRPLLEYVRNLHLEDADLSLPPDPAPSTAAPTSIPVTNAVPTTDLSSPHP